MGKSVFDYNDGDFIFSTSSLGHKHLGQGKDLGLVVHQSQHDHAEGILELGVL